MKKKQTLCDANTVRTADSKKIVFMYETDLNWQKM